MYCSKCGCYNEAGSMYCTECGSLMTDQTQSESLSDMDDSIDIESDKTTLKKNKGKNVLVIMISVIAAVVILAIVLIMIKKDNNKDKFVEDSLEKNDESYIDDIIINDGDDLPNENRIGDIDKTQEKSSEIVINDEFQESKSFDNEKNTIINDSHSFYGIWCMSTKDYTEANNYVNTLKGYGFNASVVYTNDWGNLNNGWYAVTAGMYETESAAKSDLNSVQKICEEAYIKYTGDYLQDSHYDNSEDGNQVDSSAFYGVWCISTKDHSEAIDYANMLKDYGYDAFVVYSNDWENLNNGWYAVTAGSYETESAAKNQLSKVKSIYKDAYVKYTGNHFGDINSENDQNEGIVICIAEILDDKSLSYRYCDTYGEEFIPLEDIHYMNYSPDVKISIIDPNEEYSPYTDSIQVSIETFAKTVKSAYDWNGYGFVCYVVIKDEKVVEIQEFYLP